MIRNEWSLYLVTLGSGYVLRLVMSVTWFLPHSFTKTWKISWQFYPSFFLFTFKNVDKSKCFFFCLKNIFWLYNVENFIKLFKCRFTIRKASKGTKFNLDILVRFEEIVSLQKLVCLIVHRFFVIISWIFSVETSFSFLVNVTVFISCSSWALPKVFVV